MTDQNLLFGILALQLDFIDQRQLIAAMQAWVLAKHKPLAQILEDRGELTTEQRLVIEAAVQQHARRHGDDLQRIWAALDAVPEPVCRELRRIGDEDLDVSIAYLNQSQLQLDVTRSLPATPLAEGVGASRFQPLRPHARGGLGEVWVALDRELHREVALKEIQSPYSSQADSRARFVREAEITGRLEHPGIVPVYALGHYPDGRPYYAMRFIRGDSLKSAIEEFHRTSSRLSATSRNLGLRKLLGRFLDVCDAVEYAHSRGVLHRDLKPGNIMLGRYGETLVVDWGLAKSIGRSEVYADTEEPTLQPKSSGSGSTPTMVGMAIGTPAYMSPEQAEGRLEDLGSASDVYSLGATLYSLLTGNPPFDPRDSEVLQQVSAGNFPPPRQTVPETPRALEAICLKAMQRRPEDRYHSPRELAEDVEHWLADEPVSAYRDRLIERCGRFARKHRSWALATTAALLLVTIVSSVAAFMVSARNAQIAKLARAESRARREAEAVTNYLVEAFRIPDPELDGRRVTVAEMLERAVLWVDDTTSIDSLTRAKFQRAIGQSYLGLGMPNEARRLLQRSFDVSAQQLGASAPETLDTANKLVEALVADGEYREAVKLADSTLVAARKSLGPDHEVTLLAIDQRAQLRLLDGDLSTALNQIEQALTTARTRLGTHHRLTLQLMHDAGGVRAQMGKTDEAVKQLDVVYQARIAVLGPHHPETLASLTMLANLRVRAGQYDEAIQLFEEAVKLRAERLGPDHPDTLNTQSGLANVYCRAGRLKQGLDLLKHTYDRYVATLGENHDDTIDALGAWALELVRSGETRRGTELLREVWDEGRRRWGSDHLAILGPQNNYALALQEAGDLEQAIKLYKGSLAIAESKLGKSHPLSLIVLNNLAGAHHLTGDVDQAILDYTEVLKTQRQKLGPEHPDTLLTWNNLAAAYTDAGRHEDALRELEAVVPILRTKLGEQHLHTLIAISNFGAALVHVERFDEAIPMLEQVLKDLRAFVGNQHPKTIIAAKQLATGYAEMSRYDRAIEVYKQILPDVEHLPQDDVLRIGIHSGLALALQDAGNPVEAIPVQELVVSAEVGRYGDHHIRSRMAKYHLASILHDAHEYERAIPIYEEVLRLERIDPGTLDSSTQTTMSNLGLAYRDADRNDDAVGLFEELVEVRRKSRGSDDLATVKAEVHLAEVYALMGRCGEAVPLFEHILDVQTQQLGADHEDTFRTIINLGKVHLDMKHSQQAIEILQRCVDLIQKRREPDRPLDEVALGTMLFLVHGFLDAGNQQQAASSLEVLEGEMRKAYSDDAVFLSKSALAFQYFGDVGHAEVTADWMLSHLQQVSEQRGWSDAVVVRARAGMLQLCREYGLNQKSVNILEPILEKARAELSVDDPRTLTEMNNLAACYMAVNDPRALALLEEALPLRRKALGDSHMETLVTMLNLGKCRLLSDDFSGAEQLYVEFQQRWPADAGPRWISGYVTLMLGFSLAGQGREQESLQLLEQGYQDVAQHRATMDKLNRRNLAQILERLAALRKKQDRLPEAESWQQRSAEW